MPLELLHARVQGGGRQKEQVLKKNIMSSMYIALIYLKISQAYMISYVRNYPLIIQQRESRPHLAGH
jgi:hypothetical protein